MAAKKREPINLATATDEELTQEAKRLWKGQPYRSPGWSEVKAEIEHREEIKRRAKFPNIALGAVRCSGAKQSDELDYKRFSHEGFEIEADCPTCGGKITDMYGDYFSYPVIGKPFWITLRCHSCEDKYGHEDQGGEYGGHRAVLQINITLSSPLSLPEGKDEQ